MTILKAGRDLQPRLERFNVAAIFETYEKPGDGAHTPARGGF